MIGFDDKAASAVRRYEFLSGVIASIFDRHISAGLITVRDQLEARRTAREAARAYLVSESDNLSLDVGSVVRAASIEAYGGIQGKSDTLDLVQLSVDYAIGALAGQIELDILAMCNALRTAAQRVDLDIRSGRSTKLAALSNVRTNAPTFLFTDRAGRSYKSSKRIQDVYRLTLVNAYNEGVIQFAAEQDIFELEIYSPSEQNKWSGIIVSTLSEASNLSLYYDIRERAFHPGTTAILRIEQKDV